MAKTITMTVRLPVELKEQLDTLAEVTDRSRAYLAAQAIQACLDMQKGQIEAILQGVREADRNELVDHAEVKRQWGARLAHPVDPARP